MELARFSTSLRIQDRAECDKGTELHWARGGGHHTEKTYTGARDTTHTLLIGGIIGVGTPPGKVFEAQDKPKLQL